MTDQFRVGGGNVHQIQNQNEIQNVQNQAPHEIANARPSKLSFALRIVAGIFTLGISEGIRFLVNKFSTTQPRDNQVRPLSEDMIPVADPAVDQANTQLCRNIVRNSLPAEYQNALDDVFNQFRNSLGENVLPEDTKKLMDMNVGRSTKFFGALRTAIQESTVEVTPEIFKTLCKNIFEEHAPYLVFSSLLIEDGNKDGVILDSDVVGKTVEETILKKNPQTSNIKSLAEAKQFFSGLPDGKLILEKAKMCSILTGKYVYELQSLPENSLMTKTLTKVLNDLQKNFNGFVSEKNIQDLLAVKTPEKQTLFVRLFTEISLVKNIDQLTEKFIEDKIYGIIGNNFTNNAIASLLKEKFDANGISVSNDNVLNLTVRMLYRDSPEFEAELNNCRSLAQLSAILSKYSNVIDAKLREINANMSEMENKYLPQVHDEVKPIVKQLIHSLPFDDHNKVKAEKFVSENIKYIKTWQELDSSGTFKGAEEIINEIKKDLTFLEGTHAVGETTNNYEDNVYTTFIADSNRANYTFNGEKQPNDQNAVINKAKQIFTTPKDLQFITKLSNQRLFAHLLEKQTFLTINGRAVNPNGKPVSLIGGALVHGDSRMIMITDTPMGNALKKSDKIEYDIKMNDDKKTGTMEFKTKMYINTRLAPDATIGTIDYTIKIDFTLSEGSANGEPTIDNVGITQKFGNPF